jgi:hypothetical protein
LAVTRVPLAITTWASRMLSVTMPNFRELYPHPPPSEWPATPTVAQKPAGSVTLPRF